MYIEKENYTTKEQEFIWQNIKELQNLNEILVVLYTQIKADKSQKIPGIIAIIYNSLLVNFYVIMRRLLSTQDEGSLVTIYLKQTKSEFIALDSDDELLELFLPNSLWQWKAVKKYINKNIMHSERNNALPPKDWAALELIISDMKSAFDRMTLPSASYHLDKQHTKREAEKLFNNILRNNDMKIHKEKFEREAELYFTAPFILVLERPEGQKSPPTPPLDINQLVERKHEKIFYLLALLDWADQDCLLDERYSIQIYKFLDISHIKWPEEFAKYQSLKEKLETLRTYLA